MKTPNSISWAKLIGVATMLSACAAAPTGPNVHGAGRVHVVAPSNAWKSQDLTPGIMTISGGAGRSEGIGDHAMARRVVYLTKGSNQLAAALMFTTSQGVGGEGDIIRDPKCRLDSGDTRTYLADLNGGSTSRPGCVRAWSQVSLNKLMDSMQLEFMKSWNVELPKVVNLVRVDVMSSRGAIVGVIAITDPSIEGKEAEVVGTLPSGFPRGVAAWADALGREAKSASVSLNGVFAIPSANFTP